MRTIRTTAHDWKVWLKTWRQKIAFVSVLLMAFLNIFGGELHLETEKPIMPTTNYTLVASGGSGVTGKIAVTLRSLTVSASGHVSNG